MCGDSPFSFLCRLCSSPWRFCQNRSMRMRRHRWLTLLHLQKWVLHLRQFWDATRTHTAYWCQTQASQVRSPCTPQYRFPQYSFHFNSCVWWRPLHSNKGEEYSGILHCICKSTEKEINNWRKKNIMKNVIGKSEKAVLVQSWKIPLSAFWQTSPLIYQQRKY